MARSIRRTAGPASSAPVQDGEGEAAADEVGAADGAADGEAALDAAGDALGPADDDGAAEADAAGDALAGTLTDGLGVGIVVSSPPRPPTSP